MPSSYRSELGRLFHYNHPTKQDFTKEDWFTALGYAIGQLLRWGKRGGYDHRPTDWVEGAIALEYHGKDKWMLISGIVRQPNIVKMKATEADIVEFGLRQMKANIRQRDKRLVVEKVDGKWCAKPHQGVSADVLALYGGNYEPGIRISPAEYDYLFHGIWSQNAASIRERGVLCGGLDHARAHIHLTTTVRESRDYNTGERLAGVKGDAYVSIDLKALMTYHYEGKPVVVWLNKIGVGLTYGALGEQPDGKPDVWEASIPPELCQSIFYISSGRAVETED